jgi:hypothetical protein
MSITLKKDFEDTFKMYFYTFLLSIVAYGFALSNYTLSVDNEIPILSDFAMDMGRWGQNLIRYHLFKGHLQYFTMLLGLFLFSLTAVRLAKLFKFNTVSAYLFCGLFITFPQISYQVVFYMMSDIAGLGMLLAVLSVEIFIKHINKESKIKTICFFFLASFIIMFLTSLYQILIIVPVTIYVIHFFQNTFKADFDLKKELKKLLIFVGLIVFSGLLYLLSVKIICPPIKDSGYLQSFTSGSTNNMFLMFFEIWKENIKGDFYFGEKSFVLVIILTFVLILKFIVKKKYFVFRFLVLIFLIVSPFLVSFFITNGYHPPRVYVTSSLVFAFVIVFTINNLKINIPTNVSNVLVISIIVYNSYLITSLFYACNKIYFYDKRNAEKMYDLLLKKYPNFETTEKVVYFHGFYDYEKYQVFRLEKSEVFGGSIFQWGEADNYRVNNFFKLSNIADFNMVNKEQYESIKDSINDLPIWPNEGSIKMINGVAVFKIGQKKGAKLYFE